MDRETAKVQIRTGAVTVGAQGTAQGFRSPLEGQISQTAWLTACGGGRERGSVWSGKSITLGLIWGT